MVIFSDLRENIEINETILSGREEWWCGDRYFSVVRERMRTSAAGEYDFIVVLFV
jgi:hypothetical protein